LIQRKIIEFEYLCIGESIPIRLFLGGYDLSPTMKDVQRKFSVRYYLNLVLLDEEERRYFKQQVSFQFFRISISIIFLLGNYSLEKTRSRSR
jgi:hypothetical protein